jgi:hypothetical protein
MSVVLRFSPKFVFGPKATNDGFGSKATVLANDYDAQVTHGLALSADVRS